MEELEAFIAQAKEQFCACEEKCSKCGKKLKPAEPAPAWPYQPYYPHPYQQGWRCVCGTWVYSHQWHTCSGPSYTSSVSSNILEVK